MTFCWIVLVIGLLLFIGGLYCNKVVCVVFGFLLLLFIDLFGFGMYGHGDTSIKETQYSIPEEIIRAKDRIMVRAKGSTPFLQSFEHSIYIAKDSNIKIARDIFVDHYGNISKGSDRIIIQDSQTLEKDK